MMPLVKGFSAVVIQRLRVRLARRGPARLLSHLQQIDMVRRALQDAAWPVSKTQAKKPKLKVSFGPAISVGYESEAEYFDVDLQAKMDPARSQETLSPHLGDGYALVSVKSIPRFFPSLEESVNVARYVVQSPLLAPTKSRWEDFWRKENFLVIKKKEDREIAIDARACVRQWALNGDTLELELRFGPGRTLKPERVVEAVCGFQPSDLVDDKGLLTCFISRKSLAFEKGSGDCVEP